LTPPPPIWSESDSVKKLENISLNPPPWLSPEGADQAPVSEIFDAATLLEANLTKMHHQQATSQWIRTWSFAFVGFFLGYAYLIQDSIMLLLLAFLLVELILIIILLKDVGWHQMFWRYRDRARLCEAYLLGQIDQQTMRSRYLRAKEPARAALLRDAFSIRRLATVSTDFVESYLIVALACAFIVQLIIVVVPWLRELVTHGG
jgi:hypothetical protein